ncbi:glycosyltransferase family 2 protein [Paradesertivirga mongoliensis]|uniref:Glycosyltransferase family 2 protein n=1 Tax=Paradesertivirga mongoliensis TaxID=2100740 RepID=A0ABW4ZGP7_9SPHI|nr:glycosyltransferase [Pedobacter mongoliensis]
MLSVDIIILSYARDSNLRALTQQAIDTLYASEDAEKVKFQTIILESERKLSPYQYDNTTTIYPKEAFNFNRYLNIGLKASKSDFICFCNNDIVFFKDWASELLKAMDADKKLLSASPICPKFHPDSEIYPNTGIRYGHEIRKEISGWCFLVRREIFQQIGLFDENFSFWFADADYANTLKKYGIKHGLVTSAMVEHLDGRSTIELDSAMKQEMTTEQFWYYQFKWEHRNYFLYSYRRLRSWLRIMTSRFVLRYKA